MKMMKAVLMGLCLALFAVQPAAYADDARVIVVSKTVDLTSLVDAAGATATIAVPGAALGDACIASFAVDVVDMTVSCYVQAANAVEVRVQNESGSTADLTSTTMRVFVFSKGTR